MPVPWSDKPKPKPQPKNVCVACQGTGRSSTGWACYPCKGTGVAK